MRVLPVFIGMQQSNLQTIRSITPENRPREKILKKGADSLSDHELLAVMIGSGTRENGVERISANLLQLFDSSQGKVLTNDLLSIPGLGAAKVCLFLAAYEFMRRRLRPGKRRISNPKEAMTVLSHWADRSQEYFICISLNGANEVIAARVISIGLVNRTIVHPREVFADAITDRAAAVLLAHNHPSGNLEPSHEDREVTRRLQTAGELIGITVIDHLVFGSSGCFSFSENGLL